jgi:hypothetical protein
MGFPSTDMERHGLRDVVIVARRVLDQLLGLDLADLVGGAGREQQFSAPLGDKLVAPRAKSEFAGSSPSDASVQLLPLSAEISTERMP